MSKESRFCKGLIHGSSYHLNIISAGLIGAPFEPLPTCPILPIETAFLEIITLAYLASPPYKGLDHQALPKISNYHLNLMLHLPVF